MRISRLIRILIVLLLITSVGFVFSYWQTSNNLENQRAANESIQKIIKGIFELSIITNEYIQSKKSRIREQWDNRHASLEELFLKAKELLTHKDDRLSLDKIMENEVQAEVLFFSLDELGSIDDKKLNKTTKRKLTQTISQIQLRIQAMLSEASRMSRRSMERLKTAEHQLELTSAALIFIFWPIFIISFVLIERKVIKPLAELQQNAKKLASGDYDARIVVKGKNEVSELARSYNKLAEEIQKKITSLIDKSDRLNASQKELLNLNENLQQIIEKRTSGLRNSETRQRAILESMIDGVITLDNTLAIKNINPAVSAIFGYSQEELIGENIDFLVTDSFEVHEQKERYREAEGIHKHLDKFPIEISFNEMDIDGELMYTAIVRDITERKHAEKMKSEFVSTVSHELRTPLTAIKGALGLVTGGVVGELPEKIAELLSTANRNSDRLLKVINDLLDIQKAEAGKLEFHFEQIDLMDAIEKSITDNQGYANHYNVGIQLGNQLNDVLVTVDPHRFSQIMANLLSNAAKFSPENGVVLVHTTLLEKFVKISVEDRGHGIPQEFHDRIFSKFSQVDSSSTRAKGGTGLGLAITKQMIEQMGGKIDFSSTEGEGTIFNFYIPLADS